MDSQEKVIKLINTIDELFDYFDIDDVIMTNDYDNNLGVFSNKLNEIFSDGLDDEVLSLISRIDKIELFYVTQVDEYENNDIRKEIVQYLDNSHLYFDYNLIKKYIKDNYKLAKYVKNREKLLELSLLNKRVILLMDVEYLTEDFILEQMKKSDFITEVFLGIHGEDNNIYRFSMFYKNNKDINKLLFEQSLKYLEQDKYNFINASLLVKSNLEIAEFIFAIDPRFVHYMSDDLQKKFIS